MAIPIAFTQMASFSGLEWTDRFHNSVGNCQSFSCCMEFNSRTDVSVLEQSSLIRERERERSVCVCCPRSHRWNRKEKDGRSNRIHTDGESRRSLLIKAGLKGERRYSFGFGALRRLLLCACAAAAQGEKKKKRAEGRGGSERERERKRKD